MEEGNKGLGERGNSFSDSLLLRLCNWYPLGCLSCSSSPGIGFFHPQKPAERQQGIPLPSSSFHLWMGRTVKLCSLRQSEGPAP